MENIYLTIFLITAVTGVGGRRPCGGGPQPLRPDSEPAPALHLRGDAQRGLL